MRSLLTSIYEFFITHNQFIFDVLFASYSQYLGAILASAVVFGVYHEALLDFEERNGNADGDYFLTPKTAGIWATYPQEFLTHQGGLADQIVSTGLSNSFTNMCLHFTMMSASMITRFVDQCKIKQKYFRAPLALRVRHHRQAQHVRLPGARPALRRLRRPQHRNVLWIQLRLRHQSGQGFGSEVSRSTCCHYAMKKHSVLNIT